MRTKTWGNLKLIKRVVQALEETNVNYMFTGALAASYYGLPRTTIDVVVKATEETPSTLAVQMRKAGTILEMAT